MFSSPSDIHRDSVCRKFYFMRGIKIIQRFDQADTPHLKQIVHAFAAVLKFLYDTQDKPQISRYESFPQRPVSRPDAFDHVFHLHILHDRKSGGIDSADFYLICIHISQFLPLLSGRYFLFLFRRSILLYLFMLTECVFYSGKISVCAASAVSFPDGYAEI